MSNDEGMTKPEPALNLLRTAAPTTLRSLLRHFGIRASFVIRLPCRSPATAGRRQVLRHSFDFLLETFPRQPLGKARRAHEKIANFLLVIFGPMFIVEKIAGRLKNKK
jgi:hypothetical protein